MPLLADGGLRRAGAVLIVPGSPLGLATPRRQLITQSTDGLPDVSEVADYFGRAVASADFDADGNADLAIGSSEQLDADPNAFGAVTVLYGSPAGLTGVRSTQLSDGGGLRPRGVPDDEIQETDFAGALVAGDVDSDGFADLVVATLGFAGYRDRAAILHGSRAGLTPDRMRWLVSPNRVGGENRSVLALGDINRDGHPDLVEGDEGEAHDYDGSGGESGYLTYCSGTPAGPTRCESLDGYRVPRRGAASLAIGDVTGDGFPDIVAGVPNDRRYGPYSSRPGAGAVVVLRGARHGPAAKPLVIRQETTGVPGRPAPLDRFGGALAVGRLNGDRYADIVVGAPGEDRVTVLRGGRRGVRARGASGFGRRVTGAKRAGRRLGSALSLHDHNTDGRLDLTVGSGGANPGLGGTVVTLLGRRGGFRTTGAQLIDADLLGLPPAARTALGWVLGG